MTKQQSALRIDGHEISTMNVHWSTDDICVSPVLPIPYPEVVMRKAHQEHDRRDSPPAKGTKSHILDLIPQVPSTTTIGASSLLCCTKIIHTA